jgi:peptidyl-dipeptidase A
MQRRRLRGLSTLALLLATTAGADTKTEAEFINSAEQEMRLLDRAETRAYFLQFTDSTPDHQKNLADIGEFAANRRTKIAKQAASMSGSGLSDEDKRKLDIMKRGLGIAYPLDPEASSELSDAIGAIRKNFVDASNCAGMENCRERNELYGIVSESDDPEQILGAWLEWRSHGAAAKDAYAKYVQLTGEGAREIGYNDLGHMWRSAYEMDDDALRTEYDRLWKEVSPLYEALHCRLGKAISERFGPDVIEDSMIPAHLTGHMWGLRWSGYLDRIAEPGDGTSTVDYESYLGQAMEEPESIVRTGEAFFKSMGMRSLPDSFWETAMLTDPADRDVNCGATTYSLDVSNEDVRLTMCLEPTKQAFETVHHELGHVYYHLAYVDQPFLFQTGANPAFHESIGDAIGLSMTPAYWKELGVLDDSYVSDQDAVIREQLASALDLIPGFAMDYLAEVWRWGVLSGETPMDSYVADYWDLMEREMGMFHPTGADEDNPGMLMDYLISNQVPSVRYYLARLMRFDIHKALCEASGFDGPLHECSIYGSEAAGDKLHGVLELGASQPWPETLEVLTGSRKINGEALLEYYQPLIEWLEAENEGSSCD